MRWGERDGVGGGGEECCSDVMWCRVVGDGIPRQGGKGGGCTVVVLRWQLPTTHVTVGKCVLSLSVFVPLCSLSSIELMAHAALPPHAPFTLPACLQVFPATGINANYQVWCDEATCADGVGAVGAVAVGLPTRGGRGGAHWCRWREGSGSRGSAGRATILLSRCPVAVLGLGTAPPAPGPGLGPRRLPACPVLWGPSTA